MLWYSGDYVIAFVCVIVVHWMCYFECVCVYILRYRISFEVLELEAKSDVVVEQQAIKSKHTVAEKKHHQKYLFCSV